MKIIENSPTLETERLILRKFQEDDLNAFASSSKKGAGRKILIFKHCWLK